MNDRSAAGRIRISTDWPAFAFLALVVAAGFGYKFQSLGFYNDDYTWLSTFAAVKPASFMNLARAASQDAGFTARIGVLVFLPVLYMLCGLKPLLYQSVALATDLAVAWNFYALLRSEGLGGVEALLAAGLAALYPNHDSTHHWVTGAPLALAGTLWSVRAFREGTRTRSVLRRVAAAVVFIYCSLLYEAAALLALLPVIIDLFRREPGETLAAAARRAVARNWPMPASLGLVVAYQRVFVPYFHHIERHRMTIHPGHFVKVIRIALECTVLNRLTDSIYRATRYSLGHFGAHGWLFFLGAVVVVAAAGRRLLKDAPRPAPDDLLPIFAVSFFLLGYMPYFFDTTYLPSIFDATNRINLVGSLGGASFFAWLILKLRAAASPAGRKAGAVLLAASFCGFLIADQASNDQWARAFVLQQKILADVVPHIEAVPDPAAILLYGFPERMGSGVVFESTYDFDLALRLRTHRPEELRGLVGQGRIHFEPDRAVLSWFGEFPVPYANLYAYDESRDSFLRIPDKKAGDEFLRDYASSKLPGSETK